MGEGYRMLRAVPFSPPLPACGGEVGAKRRVRGPLREFELVEAPTLSIARRRRALTLTASGERESETLSLHDDQ
jgi:hypothetical protein